MAEILAPFLILIALGVVSRKIPGFPPADVLRRHLSQTTLWIFLPALSFRVLYHAVPDESFWIVPVVATASLIACVILAKLVYQGINDVLARFKRHRIPDSTLGALILCSAWGNITFFGLPFLTSVYGTNAQKIALLYDLFAIGPLVYTLGAHLAASYSPSRHRSGAITSGSFATILKLPPLWAAAIGVVFQFLRLPLPRAIDHSFEIMAAAVTPVMIYCVGLALAFPNRLKDWAALSVIAPAVAIKLVISPMIAAALLGFIAPDALTTCATVLEAAMPVMVVTLVITDHYGLNSKVTAQMIAITTLASLLTLPAVKSLIEGMAGTP